MTDVKTQVRVLQSGKVYRQIFDAEVQLMKSLDASKLKQSHGSVERISLPELTSKASEQSKQTFLSTPSVLSHNGTMLTNRQKTWTEGMPNDGVTENPVFYRQLSAAATKKIKELTLDKDVEEVHGLPNIVQSQKKNSNINERIAEKRKERHESCLEEMHNNLCLVSNRSEPRVTVIGENLQSQLQEDDIIIATLFRSMSSDEDLLNFSFERLGLLWNEVEAHSPKRRKWVDDAHRLFNEVEDERLEAISAILKTYGEKLGKIAYLLPPDVHRLIEKEAMMINQSILANRRSYAKLHVNLLEGDIEREVDQRRSWMERVKDWKKLNAELAVEQFTNFMRKDEIFDPPGVDEIVRKYLEEQRNLSVKRQNILDQINELKPPVSSKSAVLKWNTALAKCNEDLDSVHSRMLRALHQEYEATCQMCLTEIEKYKQNLLLSNVCDEEDMKRIVNDHLLPQVGSQLKVFEKKLEKMDKHLEDLAVSSELQMKDLFQFVHEAAHLWDLHEAGMAKQKRRLQNELEQTRESHDIDNQEREMKLDVTLDRLRQESTEEELNHYLEQCLAMLGNIKNGYATFHAEELDKVANYPSMIDSEVLRYEKSVCEYFHVARKQPAHEQTEDEEMKLNNDENVKQRSFEVLTTDKGTEFYILPSDSEKETELENEEKEEDQVEDGGNKDEGKIKDEKHKQSDLDASSDESDLPHYIEQVYIPTDQFEELKRRVRMSFLNHLEEWKESTSNSAEMQAQDKTEELIAEYDLRLHLHAPRAKRIEVDVRNVRAAELVLHRERVSRHCRGITAALDSLKSDFVAMTKSHDEEAAAFRDNVENIDSKLSTATKSSKLKSLNDQMQSDLIDYVDNVKTSLRNFRQVLDVTLGKLRESNAQCARSFKLFCEGGNFSPDETFPLRKRLEKASQRVDNAEGAVMRDLEGMESRRIEQGTEWVSKAEEKYRNHHSDLSFAESMQRWATNAQVLIKSEAALSNGMAAEIAGRLSTLRRRVDACERPNFDKEDVSTELLHEYALEIIGVLQKRAEYLDCLVSESPPQPEDADQNIVPSAMELPKSVPDRTLGSATRKSVTQLGSRQSMDGVGAYRGRQPSDDAAIGLIRTILRAPREKTILDVDDVRSTATGATRAPPSTANSTIVTSARHGKNLPKTGGTASSTITPEPPSSRRSVNDGVTVTYKRRETKFEAKYMVFGAKPAEGSHWTAKINQLLYNALDGMLSSAEIYYKQKGPKPPVRQQLVQDSFDGCADKVVEKLFKYENQAKDFHNDSLQEFRKQLHDLEYELCNVPRLILNDILHNQLRKLSRAQKDLEKRFREQEKLWEDKKQSYKTELRPTMGHPDQNKALGGISDLEKKRHEEQERGVEDHARAMQRCLEENSSQFADDLSTMTGTLLKEFDKLLIIDDVIVGRVPPHKELTSVLLRRRADGYDMTEVADPSFGVKPIIQRGPGKWPPCDFHKLRSSDDKPPSSDTAAGVQETSHTTLPQAKTTEYRNRTFDQFLSTHQEVMEDINNSKTARLQAEERWRQNWEESIDRVKSLYK